MFFWLIICAVVGFFLPAYPGGMIFVLVAAVLTALLGWARAVRHFQNAGRDITGSMGASAFGVVFLTQFAVTAVGYLIGLGARAVVM